MKLTICLVSKGRPAFIAQLLDSFDSVLDLPEVNFFVLDNGADAVSSNLLETWANLHSDKCTFHRNTLNDPRPSSYWSKIFDSDFDWVMLPGDDDVLLRDGIVAFLELVRNRPDLNVVGGSAVLVGNSGIKSSKTIIPAARNDVSVIENFVVSLHGPSFIWPATFFRPQFVGVNVPSSRFAFDWYLDCIFVLDENFLIMDKNVIQYRIHDDQETNLGSLRRKYFEGFFWLKKLIDSQIFSFWLNNLNYNELQEFWKLLLRTRPIFGDPEYGNFMIFEIAQCILKLNLSDSEISGVILDLASLNRVYLGLSEVEHFFRSDFIETTSNRITNINFLAESKVCVADKFPKYENSQKLNEIRDVMVSCKHSKTSEYLIIECDNYIDRNAEEFESLLIKDFELWILKNNELSWKLTSMDRKILEIYPLVLSRLPRFLRNILRRILKL